MVVVWSDTTPTIVAGIVLGGGGCLRTLDTQLVPVIRHRLKHVYAGDARQAGNMRVGFDLRRYSVSQFGTVGTIAAATVLGRFVIKVGTRAYRHLLQLPGRL